MTAIILLIQGEIHKGSRVRELIYPRGVEAFIERKTAEGEIFRTLKIKVQPLMLGR